MTMVVATSHGMTMVGVQGFAGAPNVHKAICGQFAKLQTNRPASLMTLSRSCWMSTAANLKPGYAGGHELAIGADHEELLEINECDIPAVLLQAGASFSGSGWTGLIRAEIENKMFRQAGLFWPTWCGAKLNGIFHQQFNKVPLVMLPSYL